MVVETNIMKSTQKTCSKCLKTKSVDEFYTVTRKVSTKKGVVERSTLREKCKECCKNYSQSRRDLRYYLPRLYGITEEEYNEMRENQNYCCALCGVHENVWWEQRQKRLFVDHDHKTNKVRGLLCGHCNTGLGNFKDRVDVLEKAIRYLNDSIS